jgi:hypothetical protein
LRGEYPAGLLPAAPDGYILKRIRELARESLYLSQTVMYKLAGLTNPFYAYMQEVHVLLSSDGMAGEIGVAKRGVLSCPQTRRCCCI